MIEFLRQLRTEAIRYSGDPKTIVRVDADAETAVNELRLVVIARSEYLSWRLDAEDCADLTRVGGWVANWIKEHFEAAT